MEDNFEDNQIFKVNQIKNALEDLRKNEIKTKVHELKVRLPNLGRCTICTLRIPCKHFKTISEVKRVPELEIKTSQTLNEFDVTEYLPKIVSDPYTRGFSIRTKGQSPVYNFEFDRRHTSLPNEKRLKQLEVIESYREEKLKKEIDKIHKIKQEEEEKKLEQESIERIRKKYLQKQKEKLQEYKETIPCRKEILQEFIDAENEKKKKIEEKRKKYLEKQKQKLAAYHEQKQLMTKISKQKVLELEESVVNYKPIKIKHLN